MEGRTTGLVVREYSGSLNIPPHRPSNSFPWCQYEKNDNEIYNVFRATITSSNGNIFRVLALYAGNSLVTGEFPSQKPVTRSFDVSLICALTKRLSKQSWGWWFETPSRSLWRHCNGSVMYENILCEVHQLMRCNCGTHYPVIAHTTVCQRLSEYWQTHKR